VNNFKADAKKVFVRGHRKRKSRKHIIKEIRILAITKRIGGYEVNFENVNDWYDGWIKERKLARKRKPH